MGRKIFVSYKYADSSVYSESILYPYTVIDYADQFERLLSSTDHIYKGEHEDEDLSLLNEDTIWEKLKDRIYDSSLTVIFISPNMKEWFLAEKHQWIPWEISYSLKETSRKDKNGHPITSRSNAMIAVVLPDQSSSYTYYLESRICCSSGCEMHYTNKLFEIIRKNKFNKTNGATKICSGNSTIWTGTCSYIEAVKWCDLIRNIDFYIDRAYERQDNIIDYEITKNLY